MSTGTNSSKRAPQRSGSSSSRKKMSAKKRKAKQRRRIIFFAVEIVALIVLLIAIVGVNMVTKIDKIKINEEDIVVNPQVENNKEMKGYRNIALFGVDSRKGKLGKGSRSDSHDRIYQSGHRRRQAGFRLPRYLLKSRNGQLQ